MHSKEKKIISVEAENGIGKFLINVCMPCLLLSSLSQLDLELSKTLVFQLLGITAGTYLLLLVFGYLGTFLFRIPQSKRKYFTFLMLFNNVANIGYPVISSLFGADGMLYATFSNLVFMILLWTLGIWLLSDTKEKFSFKSLLTPGFVSILLGYLLCMLKIDFPDVLILSLKKLGDMTGPLAMIVVGCSLADQELKNIARNYNLIKFAVIKQILLPVLIFFVLRLFCSDDVVWIIVILASMPTAVNLVAFIGERGEDSATAAQAVIVSTLISLPMIPVLLWLMRLF